MQYQEQVQILAMRQEKVREEERTRISRELHDVLGQALTVFKLGLSSAMQPLVKREDESDLYSIGLQLRQMSSNVDYMIKCVRKIASELRPPILDSLGLVPALEWQIDEFSRATSLNCQFVCSEREFNTDKDQATALFRCTQELLTNVARHADAESVFVSLEASEDSLVLEVNDNGRGLVVESDLHKSTLGLLGISERVKIAGGIFTIEGGVPNGTRASIKIPQKANVQEQGFV